MFESLTWHIQNFIHSPKLYLLPLSIISGTTLVVIFILITIPILRKYNIVDIPSTRRVHKKPTVRGGGIALVFAFLFSIYLVDEYTNEQCNMSNLLLPISLLGIISFIDDVKGLGIFIRLGSHFIASYLCLSAYLYPHLIFRGELIPPIDMFLSVVALVSFLNIYNFLDGIDGISAIQSIHLSLTTLILCILRDKVIINIDIVFYSSSILLGCSIGFLFFNWHPASLFLGDVGSTLLGILHGMNLLIIAASSERLFLAATISSLYYIADGGITILIRIINKEKFWLPHLNHFFQQAGRKGMSNTEVVKKVGICNIILLALSVMSIYLPHISIIFSLLTVTYTLVHFQHDKLHS